MAPRSGLYAILEIAPDATQRQIRDAYRRLARATHPDRNPGAPDLEPRFKRVSRAYAILSDPDRRQAYDERMTRGRFMAPGTAGPASYVVDSGPIYHSDLGHHSDFYQHGDPLSVAEAAVLVKRDGGWLRRAIRSGRLQATRSPVGYLLRRRDVERLDRTTRRRVARGVEDDDDAMDTSES